MTQVAAVAMIATGLAYLALSLVLSRHKRHVGRAHGAEPEHFVFVVPALDEEAVIASTVAGLLRTCGVRGEVFVIDDGSTDATAAILDSLACDRLTVLHRVAPEARTGKGAALNAAFRMIRDRAVAAGTDPRDVVVCIVDADGRLEADCLDHVAPYFTDPGVGALQLLVRIRNRERWLARCQDYEFLVFSSLTQTAREHLGSVGLGGNGQFARLAALMELGDEPWTDCLTEDLDLGVRIAVNGWRNRFCAETFVDQQGLTSIPLLLRQRTRWAHGHLQCWKLLPKVIVSDLPTVTVLDLSYYLLAPALVLVASAVFTFSTIVMAYQFAVDPTRFLTPFGFLVAGLVYTLSFGPALFLSTVYRRRSGELSVLGSIGLAHVLAAYNYIWYVAEWKAVVRILLRRNRWAKTTRSVEGDRQIPVGAMAASARSAVADSPRVGETVAAADHDCTSPDDTDEGDEPMPSDKRVLVCFGTRPEAIKMAPVIRALHAQPGLEPYVAVTGQHPEMVGEVLDVFDIVPDADLGLYAPGQPLTTFAGRAQVAIGDLLREIEPDAVVVQGDTSTTFAAALAGFYERVPVVHLEAGLRTGDLESPFPEEANRRLTTTVTSLHLAATPANRDALVTEGVVSDDIAIIGNTVIDALHLAVENVRPTWADPALAAYFDGTSYSPGPLMLVTAHRRESWGDPLCEVARAVAIVAEARPEMTVVWPLHPNPAVQAWVSPIVGHLDNVVVTGPAAYPDFVRLLQAADVVLTDSGGVQEEAPALGVPVLVTRDVTERQEAVDCGAAVLVGTDRACIVAHVSDLLDRADHERPAIESPFGDGEAGRRVAAAVAELLDVGHRRPDFVAPATTPGDTVIAVAGARARAGRDDVVAVSSVHESLELELELEDLLDVGQFA